MSLFWFLIGMLTTVAILCVLLPWLRTIPRLNALPALPWQVPLVAVLMIVSALLMYRWLGHPETVQTAAGGVPPLPMSVPSAAPGDGTSAASMQSALAALQARLAKGGGTPDDWELLAKSYDFLGRADDAAKARAHQLPSGPLSNDGAPGAVSAAALLPAPTPTPDTLKQIAKANRARSDKQFATAVAIYAQLAARNQLNAEAWADYADAAGSAQGGKLAGAPEAYIARSLALDARQPKALWLKASADEEAGRASAAVADWRQLQAVLPPDSDDAKIVAANLQHATGLSGAAPDAAPPLSGAAVSGEVSLAPALQGKAPAGATLFIVAKSVDSPGAPVAVIRSSVGDWPVKFTLDDSLSMLPGRNLSSAGRVTIEARISKSGQALPSSGDLRGKSGIINPAIHAPLRIVIDEVIS